jgi:hypothetical protein
MFLAVQLEDHHLSSVAARKQKPRENAASVLPGLEAFAPEHPRISRSSQFAVFKELTERQHVAIILALSPSLLECLDERRVKILNIRHSLIGSEMTSN